MSQIGNPLSIPLRVAEPVPAMPIVIGPKTDPAQIPLPLVAPERETVKVGGR